MRLLDYLDKGASLGAAAPCLTMHGHTLDYGAVQRLSYRVGRALARPGVRPGDKVAILSGNDPVAMSYPFEGLPRYLALAPLTHAAGVLCFPVMTLGGEMVIMPAPDLAEFIALAARRRITHTFLPPTLIYTLLGHPDLPAADLSALQCLWYGAAPMSAARLAEAITTLGPVLGQLFGQTEAPMMLSTLAPEDRLGGVKAPKQVEVWPDPPRSKVGKVIKADIKATLRGEPDRR
ncbi:MAG: AMP-binding protein [Streptosporangiaceae bacterium]